MDPEIVRTPDEMRAVCNAARGRGGRVGLVPTMGALHEGHLMLVRAAAKSADFVAVSIFVNPTQFGPAEDFSRYPRDLKGDVAKLQTAGAHLVFAPDAASMYAAGDESRVRVGATAEPLEGLHRPMHFEGVTTIVAKLLNIAGPCSAVFGKKDYQQLAVIRRMVSDLFMPVHLIAHPIVRESDGMAMSSRNAYLSAEDRVRARALSRGLAEASLLWEKGERSPETLRAAVQDWVSKFADAIDYVAAVDPDRLVPFAAGASFNRLLLAIACRIGTTRLIDNIVLGEDPTLAFVEERSGVS